tara:strand:+ start:1599 stop:2219 length:621 start_codon:yes stop_codon:yes gene_type:complete
MKILNLYACLGGNRYKWDEVADVDVTAVELDPECARLYQERFPNDKVIVADAHQYLLDHYKEFDFIWSSPPCPTHSRTNYFTQHIRNRPVYPDIKLYEEIIFLNNFYKGKFCVENVISYYEPLIKPYKIGRHYFWTNFSLTSIMPIIKLPKDEIGTMDMKYGNKACKKPVSERNAVNSDLGLYILNKALGITKKQNVKQKTIFDEC